MASLCRRSVPGCLIHVIKNDELTIDELTPLLKYFSAIVIGPGPGSPDKAVDIGIIKDLWRISDSDILPIFGVCLGLQSLGVEFGARLHRLKVVKHGQVSEIHHSGKGLFSGLEKVHAVRYHSLHIRLTNKCRSELDMIAWAADIENGRVTMGLAHKMKPFWAVQYHPESVLTTGGGSEVISNFWKLACAWTAQHQRQVLSWESTSVFPASWPDVPTPRPPLNTSPNQSSISTTISHLPTLNVSAICELLGVTDESKPFVLLDSAARPGRYSIIGCPTDTTLRISYTINHPVVNIARGPEVQEAALGDDIWTWLADFMQHHRARGHPNIPFWGGLVGYLSYELGLLEVAVKNRSSATRSLQHPDVNLMFVERSIVIDSLTGNVYVQSILPNDEPWIGSTTAALKDASMSDQRILSIPTPVDAPVAIIPDKDKYISHIQAAKEFLFSGDSYELCLTARSCIRLPASNSFSHSTSWERFKSLRSSNPAPYAAYLRLHPSTVMSSSPERFLSYSRAPETLFQYRPIKGTVRKGDDINYEMAERLLAGSIKEVAENLMIVDLIRHDLHSVVGEDVRVKQFCKVEEYETVYQLVSVVEGNFGSEATPHEGDDVGWQVLRKSLPPGQ